MIITMQHVRANGHCAKGTRTWFARHDLDFKAFLKDGIDADVLLAIGDALALAVVEKARMTEAETTRQGDV